MGSMNQMIFLQKIYKKSVMGSSFDVFVRNEFYHTFTIPLAGDHAILNALGIIALCHYEGVEATVIQKRLSTFHGVKRRFTISEMDDRIIVDDYAHHPTEIRATLQSAKQKYPDREIVAVFQPHTYTRTAALLEEFASSLSAADHVYLCDIFGSAREKAGDLTVEDVVKRIPGAKHLVLEESQVLDAHGNAVYLFMGAGDVQKYMNAFKKILEKGKTA